MLDTRQRKVRIIVITKIQLVASSLTLKVNPSNNLSNVIGWKQCQNFSEIKKRAFDSRLMYTASIPTAIAASTWPWRALPVTAKIGILGRGSFPVASQFRIRDVASRPSLCTLSVFPCIRIRHRTLQDRHFEVLFWSISCYSSSDVFTHHEDQRRVYSGRCFVCVVVVGCFEILKCCMQS